MQAQALFSNSPLAQSRRSSRSVRYFSFKLLLATATLALAAGAAQTALAQPGPGFGGRGGLAGPGMMLDGPHAERVLSTINATPEQRAQLKQIFQAARADLKTQRDAGRGLAQQAQALFTQPVVDARAAEALRAQMSAQHDAASKRMLQAMLDASRVLTPEQRKTLADKMAERRTLMERHRAERDSLDRPTR